MPGIALSRPVALGDLRQSFGGAVASELAHVQIEAIAAPEFADPRCLTPLLSRRFLKAGLRSGAAALLVDGSLAADVPATRGWFHERASWAFAELLESCLPARTPCISARAVIEPGAAIGDGVDIGAGAVLMDGCQVGPDCTIGPNAVIYGGVRLGARVVIGASAVLGRAGFGWAFGSEGRVRRIPQLGGVVVEDDVEVGPVATVDAGTLHPTRLGRGCKLDAHVHVGHNVQIGAGCLVAAQAGFAGSATIGAAVMVGGQAGVADHVVVGDGARLAGKAGVIGNVPPAMTVAGYPAIERIRWLRSVAKALRGSR